MITIKIVVPVDIDKKTIYKRTGKAPFFLIYEDRKLVDIMINNHVKNHDDENHHEENSEKEVLNHIRDIQNLKNCDIILAQAIGKNMGQALESIGLKIQKISRIDGITANEVIDKFLQNKLKRQQ